MGAFTQIEIKDPFGREESITNSLPGFVPIEIKSPFEEKLPPVFVQPEKPSFMQDVVSKTGKDIGGQLVSTAETTMSMASGMLLWPFAKAYGVMALPLGKEAADVAEAEILSLGYQPYTKAAKEVNEIVAKGFEFVLHPTEILEQEIEQYSPRTAYLAKLGGELLTFALGAKTVGGAKGALTKKMPWDKPLKEAPKLDSTFAKNEVNKRRAKEKAGGRPLLTLKNKEAMLKAESEQAAKQAEVDATFAPDAMRRAYKKHEKPPVNIEGKPIPREDGMIVEPKPSFLDVATERLGGKVEPNMKGFTPISIEPIREYGLKFLDREYLKSSHSRKPIPESMKKQAERIVRIAEKKGKTAEEAAIIFDDFLSKNATLKGKVELAKRLKAEESRTVSDIAKDVNTALGERGSIGGKTRTPEQEAAYHRLRGDVEVFAKSAKKVGKTLEQYLLDMKMDPKVAALLARTGGDLKKYAGSVNLKKQDIPEQFKQFETDIAQPKRVQTWDETGKLSAEIVGDYKKASKVLEKAKKGSGLNRQEMDAVRQINVNAIHRLGEIAKTVELDTFIGRVNTYKADVFNALTKASSTAGGALNMHKRDIAVTRLGIAFNKMKRDLNQREFQEFKEINWENPLEIKRFMKRLGDPKLSDYFLEYWYNSILSGPPTHFVNAVGNTAWTLFQVPHRGLSGLIDIPYAKLTGKQRTRYLNEMIPMMAGYKRGFPKGRRQAIQIWRDGEIKDFESKWAQEMHTALGAFERSPNALVRKVGKAIDPPTRLLRMMDVWARSVAYDGHAAALARRSSNGKGLKGKAREKYERDFVENMPEQAHKEAMQQADYSVFMDKPDPVSELIITDARTAPVIGPLLKATILPFVNTISNLLKRGLEITPVVGVGKEAVSRGMKKGFVEKGGRGSTWAENRQHNTPDVIAKQIEGAFLAFYVWNKFAKGEMTGALPEGKAERDSWYRRDVKPHAMKFGDTWFSYRRAEPFNTPIAAAGSSFAAAKIAFENPSMSYEDQVEAATQVFFEASKGLMENIIDGSYFQGLQSAMDRHGKLESAAARWSASLIPYSSLFRSLSRGYEILTEGEAKPREGGEFQKAFSQVMPWLINKPPPKLDVWGEEAVIPGGIFRQWLPYKWSTEKKDPVEDELKKFGYYPALPNQVVTVNEKEIKLDDDIYRKFVINVGKEAYQHIKNKIANPVYKAAGPERDSSHKSQIKTKIESIRSTHRKKAIKEQRKRDITPGEKAKKLKDAARNMDVDIYAFNTAGDRKTIRRNAAESMSENERQSAMYRTIFKELG